MVEMDETDRKILQLLKENARMTYVDIGRAIGLSEGAVRNRVQALVNSGAIRRFTIEVAPSPELRALIMISVNPSIPTSKVSTAIRKLNTLERIYEVTGEYDIVAVVLSPNIEVVNQSIEDIRGIEGVMKTNTMIILRTF